MITNKNPNVSTLGAVNHTQSNRPKKCRIARKGIVLVKTVGPLTA